MYGSIGIKREYSASYILFEHVFLSGTELVTLKGEKLRKWRMPLEVLRLQHKKNP
jgi:hypothetical protein